MVEIVVGSIDDIPEGSAKLVTAGDCEIAVFNIAGEFFAIGNTCPHRGGPLSEGSVNDNVVSCPLHNWQFNIQTGESLMSPNTKVPTYKVEIRGDQVVLIV